MSIESHAGEQCFSVTMERSAWRCATIEVWADTPDEAKETAERYAREHRYDIPWSVSADYGEVSVEDVEPCDGTQAGTETPQDNTGTSRVIKADSGGLPAAVTVGAPDKATKRKLYVDIETKAWVTAAVTVRANDQDHARREAEVLMEADPDDLDWVISPDVEDSVEAVDVRDE